LNEIIKRIKSILLVFFILINTSLFSQSKNISDYKNILDSAEAYYPSNLAKSDSFIKLITLQQAINLDQEFKANYYYLLAMLDVKLRRDASSYKNYSLAVLNAEKSGNDTLIAETSYWLSTRLFLNGNDSLGNIYLEKSKHHYTIINDPNGYLKLLQMEAYQEYVNHRPAESNKLILENIDQYKAATEDGYYYMFANFLLASNSIDLNKIDDGRKYHQIFSSLRPDSTVAEETFDYFESLIYMVSVNYFYKQKNVDSCLFYLQKIEDKRSVLDYVLIYDLYLFYIDVYKLSGNIDGSLMYLDSLKILQKTMLENSAITNAEISETILDKENELRAEAKSKQKFINTAIFLVLAILIILGVFLVYRKKSKSKIDGLSDKLNNYDFLNDNQNKLKIKIAGLEDYIRLLKEDISKISDISDTKQQQSGLKELYKKLNIEINNTFSRKDNHIDLVNKLNADFFVEIKNKHPELNESEIVVCYYLFIGLKNNEIATFLNSSVRAIESKRFRISKKINLDTSNTTLPEYLISTFDIKNSINQ